MTSLKRLHFGHMNLTGSIPESVSNLKALKDFAVNNNYLNGTIPISMGALVNLSELKSNRHDYLFTLVITESSPNYLYIILLHKIQYR